MLPNARVRLQHALLPASDRLVRPVLLALVPSPVVAIVPRIYSISIAPIVNTVVYNLPHAVHTVVTIIMYKL